MACEEFEKYGQRRRGAKARSVQERRGMRGMQGKGALIRKRKRKRRKERLEAKG